MYRDDDEAAHARAYALQRSLDETQDELAAAKAKLAAAEAEKARLADEVDRISRSTRPETAVPARAPRRRMAPRDGVSAGWAILGVTLLSVLGLVCVATRSREKATAVPDPLCELRSDPPGARIVQRCRDRTAESMNKDLRLQTPNGLSFAFPETFEMTVGTTPYALRREDWNMRGSVCGGWYILTLAGYEDEIVSPVVGTRCNETTVRLRPSHGQR